LTRINESVAQATTVKELWFEYLEGLEQDHSDVAYAMVYSSSTDDDLSRATNNHSSRYSLEGSIGLPAGHPSIPLTFDLDQYVGEQDDLACACRRAVLGGDVVVLQQRNGTLPREMAVGVPGRAGGGTVNTVCILPIPDLFSENSLAFVIVALSPRRPFDSENAAFVDYLRDVLVRSASTIFLPEEHRRARQKFEEIESSLAQELRATALEAERTEARYSKMFQLAPVGMWVFLNLPRLLVDKKG